MNHIPNRLSLTAAVSATAAIGASLMVKSQDVAVQTDWAMPVPIYFISLFLPIFTVFTVFVEIPRMIVKKLKAEK